MSRPRRIWPVILASAMGLAILLWLGTWQVQRLAWKQGLIAQLAANAAAEPVDLTTADRLMRDGGSIEFLKVRFSANYKLDAGKTMIATFDGGPGWTVITPAITSEGFAVLVDRGLVPADRLAQIDMPKGDLELTGIIRLHAAGKGYFDPENDPAKNAWYWWDIPAMLQASGLPAGVKPLSFVVQLIPGAVAAEFPRPAEPRANLRNNHLGYAITWFGLAIVLLVMTAIYVRGLMKKSTA